MSVTTELIGGVQVSVETGTARVVGVEPRSRNVEVKLDDPARTLRYPLKGWLDKADAAALSLAQRAKGGAEMVAYRVEVHRDPKVDPTIPIADVPQTSRFRRLVALAPAPDVANYANGASYAPPPEDPGPGPDTDATKPWVPYNGDGSLNLGSYAAQAAAGMIDVAVEALQAAGVGVPTVAQVKALAARLLAVADAAQAAATCRPVDRMAASHTRARGLLRTALTVHPAPVGTSTEARAQWQADLTAYATGLLELVADLDSNRMPVIVGAPVSPSVPPPATGDQATVGTTPNDDPFRPFDESSMTLAGPSWARKFVVAMTASGHGPKVQAAVVHYATGGMTRHPAAVRRTQTALVAATHQRLDRGELVLGADGVLVEATEAKGGAAA